MFSKKNKPSKTAFVTFSKKPTCLCVRGPPLFAASEAKMPGVTFRYLSFHGYRRRRRLIRREVMHMPRGL